MPSFQTWGPSAQISRLPPTPPAYQSTYQTPASVMCEKGFISGQSDYQARQTQSGCDFIERYSQGQAYNAQRSINAPLHNPLCQMHGSHTYRKFPSNVFQLSVPYPYGHPSTAPLLPPIRTRDKAFENGAVHHQIQDAQVGIPPKAKDELPSGGVAAFLDYDMDLMAGFVAEMTQGIVNPGCRPAPQFYKYVVQILSSTRLPSSTIVLGLFYLASRMRIVSKMGEEFRSSGTVYQMLTTCLLLGSKFLDDNTFQNRSWADVSHIPVAELNKMELDWLKGFDWILHGPMYHEKEGFYIWREHWKAYEEDAQLAKARGTQKLAPLDTSMARAQKSIRHPLMSPEGPIPPQYQRSAQYDIQWPRPYVSEYSPPSASHSGPTTPDYYSAGNWSQAPPPYSRQPWSNSTASVYGLQRSQPPSYQRTPTYFHGYSQSVWKNHGPSCTCNLCAEHPDHYFTQTTAYGMQTVAG